MLYKTLKIKTNPFQATNVGVKQIESISDGRPSTPTISKVLLHRRIIPGEEVLKIAAASIEDAPVSFI